MKFEDDLMKYRHDAAISYLGQLLKTREDIKVQLAKPNKDLGECMNYLMSCARKKVKGQCAVLSDDEALSMAIHYYDEDDIEIEKVNGTVSASPVHEQDKNEDIEKIVSERVEKEVARIKEEVSRSNQEDVEKIVSERVQNELERISEEEKKNKKKKKEKKISKHEDATTIFDFMEV